MAQSHNYFLEILGGNIDKDQFKEHKLSSNILGLTNIGRSRNKNQDAISFFFRKPDTLLLSVADGLGSYVHSEKASLLAVEKIPEKILQGISIKKSCLDLHRYLIKAYPYEKKGLRGQFKQYLQKKLNPQPDLPLDPNRKDQGATTLVLAKISKQTLWVSNVGDSRAYVIRKEKIIYQSQDQSLAKLIEFKEKLKIHFITPPRSIKGAILNSLGSPEPFFEFCTDGKSLKKFVAATPLNDRINLRPDDIVFLATDGVFSNLTNDELVYLLTQTPWDAICSTLEKTLLRIMRMGWTNLGEKANPDNFSFIVYRHLGNK